ncbi:MAG: hypothetical protein JW969_11335 [Spirochaetales bacterium]|nr:hypothetical protein [Spirochaetales bacterium]
MANRIEWIEYKGQKILFCDFSNYDENQYLEGVDLMEKELLKQGEGSKLKLLIDVLNSHMTQKTSDRGKKTVEILTKADIVAVTAMVGITGVKRIIASAISKDVFFAKDKESAKEWLIKQ